MTQLETRRHFYHSSTTRVKSSLLPLLLLSFLDHQYQVLCFNGFPFPKSFQGMGIAGTDILTNAMMPMDRALISGLSLVTGGEDFDQKAPKKPSVKEYKGPVFNLKRRGGQSKDYHKFRGEILRPLEPDCTQSTFMSPFHDPVTFVQNISVYYRIDRTCKWNIFGTEACVPMLTCNTSNLQQPCDKEYLEIVDGAGGTLKICGGNGKQVLRVQASGDLRDLYVHFKVLKGLRGKNEKEVFTCEVVCANRTDGKALERKFEDWAKINPKCYCGTKPNEDRIMGGHPAKKFEFPWLIALVETNTRQPFCGASIINNRFVYTAGHCIKGKFTDYRQIQVVINGHFFDQTPNTNIVEQEQFPRTYPLDELEKLDKGNGSRRYNLDEIIVHPLYISETNDFDIALLKLTEDLDFTAKPKGTTIESLLQQPRAICLPPLGSYLRTYSNKKAIVAGWGLPGVDADGTHTVLQKLEVNVFPQQECKEMFAHRVNRRMMCAGYKDGGRDSCSGDSGGPLVMEDRPKVWVQIGSVSFGEGCGEREHPGVYFRTAEGVQWMTYQSNYNAARAGESDSDNSATWCVTPP